MVCVNQALCLMHSSYPQLREKSTAFCDPSQFVYNQGDFDTFRLQFVQKELPFCILTGGGDHANI